MSLRQPTSTLDRLSSLTIGDSERKSSSSHQREPGAEVSVETTGPGLVQRCVVVQKDQLGFGFTVCGERVKLVQNVRAGGAAVRAGVQEGDRIIKVNGLLVSSMSHREVVKLIKSGLYVALTLQGPPPLTASLPLEPLPSAELSTNQRGSLGGEAPPPVPPPVPSGLSSSVSGSVSSSVSSSRITGPKPLQDPEVQKHATEILRKMLEQEEAELQSLMEERVRSPSAWLEERIERAQRRAQQVRVKVQQDVDGARPDSVSSFNLRPGEGRLSMDSSECDIEAFESPHSSPSFSFRPPLHRRHNSDTNTLMEQSGKAQIIAPEELDEDDGYAFNEMDGPFQDIELLKSRPAHMTVFMRYVFSQLLDPNPLLFYLVVESYLSSGAKDARALAPQICSHFLDPDAPLKIKVREDDLTDIESRLQAQEDIRGPLSELQQQVLPEIQEQIQDYRSKQMMGLGSLFGEGDLQLLDGDPGREKQVVDKQVQALWDLLSKHEDDRSSPLAWAVLLYLRHAGIKLRDSKVFPSLSAEKEKWLLFLKTKKLSGTKKEKEKDGEDKKRNPILKYIGKPRSTSQSTFHVPVPPQSNEVRSSSVKNIIQQFENHTETEDGAGGGATDGGGGASDPQRLSTSSSLGEDNMDSPAVSVRLGRSESLKAQGEGRRRGANVSAGDAAAVPRSRSDVDMDDCGDERMLTHSTSSSSCSARSLENPTPPFTPRCRRRSVESPLALLPDVAVATAEDEALDGQIWQDTVSPQLLSTLSPREVDRQAVIYELLSSEVSHLRTLRVLDQVFFQKMRVVLNSDELACIFPNLPQVYELHASLCEAMKERREAAVVQEIGDVLLARFEGAAGEEFQEQAAQLCSQQSQARELIKSKKLKDPRFAHIIQECESSPLCRRLQLKDMLVSEMQRLTKYPLLLDNILKYTDAGSSDRSVLQRALSCCRRILRYVDEVVGETESQQRLNQYQRRLDAAPQFKSLDLNRKRLIHEGPLTWKLSKEKRMEIQALLLSDCLVLLQKGPDDRLQLRYPSRWLGGATTGGGDNKTSFSPVVKLDSLLVRPVATNNKALYVISTTESQIYELVAASASEKNTWKDLLEKTVPSAGGSSPLINHGSPSARSASPVSICSNVDSENVVTVETSDPLEPHDGDAHLSDITPADQSCTDEGVEGGVADAALRDVETLRRLILRHLEDDDASSRGSEDTPTNRTPEGEGRRPDSLETVLGDWEEGPEEAPPSEHEQAPPSDHEEAPPPEAEQPGVQVIRKAVVAGPPPPPLPPLPPPPPPLSSSASDDITGDVTLPSGQSSEPRGGASEPGNTFYLVMPTEPGESATEDPPTPTAEEVMSPPEDTPPAPELDQSEEEEETQRRVITNVDEIFHTIEGLMSKLRQLKDLEQTHYQLLKTLSESPPADLQPGDQQQQASVSRTPSLDRGSADGKEGGAPAEPKIQSTGF